MSEFTYEYKMENGDALDPFLMSYDEDLLVVTPRSKD